MAYIKFLFPIVMEFLRNESAVNSSISIEKIIYEQIVALVVKILAGILLIVIMLFALLSILGQLNTLILSYENGPLWLISLNMGIFILGFFVLFYLFKSKSISMKKNSQNKIDNSGIDAQKAIANFFEGFAEGLNKPIKSSPNKNES